MSARGKPAACSLSSVIASGSVGDACASTWKDEEDEDEDDVDEVVEEEGWGRTSRTGPAGRWRGRRMLPHAAAGMGGACAAVVVAAGTALRARASAERSGAERGRSVM
jgi:hypothetical protein